MRLIDADAIEMELGVEDRDLYVQHILDFVPTIEAEPVKHGRWLKSGQSLVCPDKFRNYFCSVCGFELDTHIRQEPNYCPNCGARMDEVEK